MIVETIGTLLDEDPEPPPNELKGELAEDVSGLARAFGGGALTLPSREARVCLVR